VVGFSKGTTIEQTLRQQEKPKNLEKCGLLPTQKGREGLSLTIGRKTEKGSNLTQY